MRKHNKASRKFAAFIITNNRPDNVLTYNTLRKHGYTGPIVLVVDDLDKTVPKYVETYGDQVVVFDKAKFGKLTDKGDNRPGLGAAVFARNACFEIAGNLGYTHFVQLDDDYNGFQYRFNGDMKYTTERSCWVLDRVFDAMNDFLDAAPVDSVALCQPGDFIGGSENQFAKGVQLRRKAMNSWFCRTDRPITFSMRMNDDVTTYVLGGVRGRLFFTTNQVNLVPVLTQSISGGMTEAYLESGTYLKTFYSVMAAPSCVKVTVLRGQINSRIHHHVSWKNTTPMIIDQKWRKTS